MRCRKQMHRSKAAAVAAAIAASRGLLDAGWKQTYRCRTCRFPDRARAWHWGHTARGRTR